MATTPNRGNPYPTDADVVDVPGDIQALAEALDNAPRYDQGPYSSMGAASRGKLFRSSEDGLLHVSDGSTWDAIGKVPVVTSLPGSPVDGQEVLYVANSTTREKWHLRYDSGKSGSYKWEVIGAKPIMSVVASALITTSQTYANLSGPAITLPLAGLYLVALGTTADLVPSSSGFGAAHMSYQIGGTAASDNDAILITNVSSSVARVHASIAGEHEKTLASAVTLASRYRINIAGTAQFARNWMRATPVWVG